MKSKSMIAYEQIKEMIFRMELLPGARVPELQISAKLDIGRTPIHDALRKLEAEGLVRTDHNKGAVITCFSDEEISQIGEIRMLQDMTSALLASRYGNAADYERLDQLADDCQRAAAQGDVYGRICLDSDFHMEIARISGNERLTQQQEKIYQQVHLIQVSKYTDIENSLTQIHHHKPLVQAIRTGDLKEIRRLSCRHVEKFYHIDPFLLQCYCEEEQDAVSSIVFTPRE